MTDRKKPAGQKNAGKKDSFYAKVSMFLGLGFWVPLLNIPLSILAIIMGITALKLAHNHPERYGGRKFAMTGIVLGFIPLILMLIAFLLPGPREQMIAQFMGKNITSP